MRRFLDIGELIISNSEKDYISTVLGSCVSVCLHSEEHRIGGIIHYLLPKDDTIKYKKHDLFYGSLAIPLLINEMLNTPGLTLKDLTAKIIGGSNGTNHQFGIGNRNIEIAKEILNHYEIPVTGEHVGNTLSRKVRFFPESGRLQVLAIEPKLQSPHLGKRHSAYLCVGSEY